MRRQNVSLLPFLVIWAGQLLSRIGSGISAFALGVHIFQKTGSTTAYSLLLLCAFLPSVLLAPVGGVIADRSNRKHMMVLGDIGSSSGILFIVVMVLMFPEREWPLYLGVGISSLFAALHSPAFKSSVTDLLEEKEYAKASGLIQLAESSRYILAPVIAVFLLPKVHLSAVLAIDMMTFIVAALSTAMISRITVHKSNIGKQSFWKDFSAGARYIAQNTIVTRLIALTTCVTFLTGILQALFAPIVLSITDAASLGAIQSLAASGMLISSVCVGFMSKTHEQGTVLTISLFVAGLFHLVIGASTSPVIITVTAFGLFLSLPFVNTSLEVLFRQNIANEVQGRIWSIISLVSQTGMVVALGISGFLADHVFNPLLIDTGLLADTVGKIIGTGAARGNGLMLVISGCIVMACPLLYRRMHHVHDAARPA